MCNRLHLLSAVLVAAATACGGGLMLPDDGSPVQLQAFSGDGQQATVGSELPDPLIARLTDASARPVSGASVEFRFQTDIPQAQVDPASATTDTTGLASARVRLGTATGPHTVVARVVEASQLRATFNVTALAQDRPGHGGGGRGGGRGSDDDGD